MTPEEQLDEARAKETLHRLVNSGQVYCHEDIAALGARLARENWTPPEPDLLAYREWMSTAAGTPGYREEVLAGKWDRRASALAYLAGARMAREREQERAKVLLAYVRADTAASDSLTRNLAHYTLANYRGEA